ncbi:hypothetical protein DYE50_05280 [Treponema ruminis]|uniref:Uncharacterized protein n=1 Tax=Treponema ruminis TaxID=744515 RepID=A0A7W8GAC4_9SPIR|nr:hypothetical protein [Treponema ruminis]MBB5226794.1 hypothetical protein [Treponema ruminis]QSI01984.1 hypothetical protein DYE50_05280 [Treponema ruminis]
MTNQKQLAEALEREQRELFSRIQTEFWETLFCDLLKKHSFQNDFFLVNANLTNDDVVNHFRKVVSQLSDKYELSFTETSHPTRTEFKLRFCYYGNKKKMSDELSVIVCIKDITMRILPHNPLLKLFWLEEYRLVEKILTGMCDELYNLQKQKFNKLQNDYKKIESSSKGLTTKTIEIAQNSIRTLYEASAQKNKSLVQRNLYSAMIINGKNVRIYHKDFLDDPKVLMNEFGKK